MASAGMSSSRVKRQSLRPKDRLMAQMGGIGKGPDVSGANRTRKQTACPGARPLQTRRPGRAGPHQDDISRDGAGCSEVVFAPAFKEINKADGPALAVTCSRARRKTPGSDLVQSSRDLLLLAADGGVGADGLTDPAGQAKLRTPAPARNGPRALHRAQRPHHRQGPAPGGHPHPCGQRASLRQHVAATGWCGPGADCRHRRL